MIAEHVRDVAVTAAILGFFASAWFGWAQERPPAGWRRFLIAGSVAALLTLVAGGLLAWRHWGDGTVFDAEVGRAYGIVVGIEFGAAGLGAVVLALIRRAPMIPVWVAFVVGVHMFPIAALFGFGLLHVTGALITVVALAAVPVARARSLAPSAVVGAPAGTILLATALTSAVAATLTT
jgi:hypothetical protein